MNKYSEAVVRLGEERLRNQLSDKLEEEKHIREQFSGIYSIALYCTYKSECQYQ